VIIARLLFGVLELVAALAGEGFHVVSAQNGIDVYEKAHHGAIELGAEAQVAATPQAVESLLLDYDHHPAWVKNLVESRVVARGTDWLDVYQRLSLPVVEDRDFTLHVTWGREGSSSFIRFDAANERGPGPVKGVVRVALHRGSWRLRASDGGRSTYAVYEFCFDPAGSVPAWMGHGRAAKEVAQLIASLRTALANHR
jgi:hypothetical protein